MIVGLWQEIRWTADILLHEEGQDREFAKWKWRTPNPSETATDVSVEDPDEKPLEKYLLRKEFKRTLKQQRMDTEVMENKQSADRLDFAPAILEVDEAESEPSVKKVVAWLAKSAKSTV
ncbi:hypothetical protein M422DRAFT_255138 [Sphaerobolus stellatus SS14]|uniref:Uncharacterized protein n=1 Tax=Sphaerobolus stellatus (strain SS14) TaxID=990650 RepID=A0A0C9V4M4_SPHS4|nr:hypothetical protein M422DRAFT_255138 [Sphaerobolus stellatus SS14]